MAEILRGLKREGPNYKSSPLGEKESVRLERGKIRLFIISKAIRQKFRPSSFEENWGQEFIRAATEGQGGKSFLKNSFAANPPKIWGLFIKRQGGPKTITHPWGRRHLKLRRPIKEPRRMSAIFA